MKLFLLYEADNARDLSNAEIRAILDGLKKKRETAAKRYPQETHDAIVARSDVEPIEKISRETGIHVTTIQRWRREAGKESLRGYPQSLKDTILARSDVEPIEKISRETGISYATIRKWRIEAGKENLREYPQSLKDAILARSDTEPIEKISRETGIHVSTIRAWRREAGKESLSKYSQEFKNSILARVDAGEAYGKISKETGIDAKTILLWRRETDRPVVTKIRYKDAYNETELIGIARAYVIAKRLNPLLTIRQFAKAKGFTADAFHTHIKPLIPKAEVELQKQKEREEAEFQAELLRQAEEERKEKEYKAQAERDIEASKVRARTGPQQQKEVEPASVNEPWRRLKGWDLARRPRILITGLFESQIPPWFYTYFDVTYADPNRIRGVDQFVTSFGGRDYDAIIIARFAKHSDIIDPAIKLGRDNNIPVLQSGSSHGLTATVEKARTMRDTRYLTHDEATGEELGRKLDWYVDAWDKKEMIKDEEMIRSLLGKGMIVEALNLMLEDITFDPEEFICQI